MAKAQDRLQQATTEHVAAGERVAAAEAELRAVTLELQDTGPVQQPLRDPLAALILAIRSSANLTLPENVMAALSSAEQAVKPQDSKTPAAGDLGKEPQGSQATVLGSQDKMADVEAEDMLKRLKELPPEKRARVSDIIDH